MLPGSSWYCRSPLCLALYWWIHGGNPTVHPCHSTADNATQHGYCKLDSAVQSSYAQTGASANEQSTSWALKRLRRIYHVCSQLWKATRLIHGGCQIPTRSTMDLIHLLIWYWSIICSIDGIQVHKFCVVYTMCVANSGKLHGLIHDTHQVNQWFAIQMYLDTDQWAKSYMQHWRYT